MQRSKWKFCLRPIVPRNLSEILDDDNNDDAEEEEEIVAENIPVLFHMPNAHIEVTILQDLFPLSDNTSIDVLKRIKINSRQRPIRTWC